MTPEQIKAHRAHRAKQAALCDTFKAAMEGEGARVLSISMLGNYLNLDTFLKYEGKARALAEAAGFTLHKKLKRRRSVAKYGAMTPATFTFRLRT